MLRSKNSLVIFVMFMLTVVSCGTPKLNEINLEALRVRPRDMPEGLSDGPVSHEADGLFKALPAPVAQLNQPFFREGEAGYNNGWLAIMLYDDDAKLQNAYDILVDGMGEHTQLEGIGTRAALAKMHVDFLGRDRVDIVFIRCRALVSVQMAKYPYAGTGVLLDAQDYARRLDKNLQAAVCYAE